MKKDLEFNTPFAIQSKHGVPTGKGKYNEAYEFDLWQELINKNDGEEFTIGHIIFWSTTAYALSTNRFITMGEKRYDLLLYNEDKSNNSSKIYNFYKGYLAPLNIKITKDMSQKIWISYDNPLNVLVSVL